MVFGVSQPITTSTFPSFMHILLRPKAKPSKGTDGERPLQSFGKLCSCNLVNIAFTVADMLVQICLVGCENPLDVTVAEKKKVLVKIEVYINLFHQKNLEMVGFVGWLLSHMWCSKQSVCLKMSKSFLVISEHHTLVKLLDRHMTVK